MTFSISELTLAYPKQLVCDFTPEQQAEALPADDDYSHDAARYRAYLNRLCLNVLSPRLQEDEHQNQSSQVFPDRLLPSIWEFVNGTPIYVENTRLVIIPSEAIDTEELSVPQEWVDIPQWSADYYLAVQVNVEDGWLRVWGFTTHEKLKNRGTYDASDRTYSLDSDELFDNLNTLWVSLQLCPAEKGAIAPLSSLSASQINNLLAKLGQPSAYSPRLKVPFAQWGALLSDRKSTQQLYQRRLGNVPVLEKIENQIKNLGNLGENIFPPGWVSLENLIKNYQINPACARSAVRSDLPVKISRGRMIDLGIKLGDHQVALILHCTSGTENQSDIVLQVYPGGGENILPPGLQLIVLDENGDIFHQTTSRKADNRIELQIYGEPGEPFTVKVALGDAKIIENFII